MSSDSKKRLAVIFIWIGAALFGALVALVIGNVLGNMAPAMLRLFARSASSLR